MIVLFVFVYIGFFLSSYLFLLFLRTLNLKCVCALLLSLFFLSFFSSIIVFHVIFF